jgi:PST family polysaccharide transporter
MSSKLAQMLLTDAAFAMGQYLFPTFSAQHRHDARVAARLVKLYLVIVACGLTMFVVLLRMTAEPLFALILGPAWMSAVPLFKIFVINMAIGALIAVLVAYLRAVGDAKATTHASLIQMVILFAIVPPLTHYWGVTGIAWSMTVGMGSAATWMLYRTLRRHDAPSFP